MVCAELSASPSPSAALCQARAALQGSTACVAQEAGAGWGAQGWAHGRRVQAAGSVLAKVALHKGHLYCVADLYIIQCSEASQSSGAGHGSRAAGCSGDSVLCWHIQ